MTSDKFQVAGQKLNNMYIAQKKTEEEEAQYMSDINNWLCVHVTRYLPQRNPDGSMFITSYAMSNDYDVPRCTVHTTLNHTVKGHAFASWDNIDYVVLAPYNDMVATNGKPAEVSAVDTFFPVHPDRGLVLPHSTYIIKPATKSLPENTLFQISENETVYKAYDFTPDEEAQILAFMPSRERQEYERLKKGDLQTWEARRIVNALERELGERGRRAYEMARDKQAFLRGIMAEKCEDTLKTWARNMAVDATAQKMGYNTIHNTVEGGMVLTQVAKTADANDIMGTYSNKGHSNTLYADIEMVMTTAVIINEDILSRANNLFGALDCLSDSESTDQQYVRKFLITGQMPDWYGMCEEMLQLKKKDYPTYYEKFATIRDFDPNLDETLRRSCAKHIRLWDQWHKKLQTLPNYKEFVQKLQKIENDRAVAKLMRRHVREN